MKKRTISLICGLVLAAVWGSAPAAYGQTQAPAADGSDVVAVIKGKKKITLKEVDEQVGLELQSLQERITSLRKRALNNLITKSLLEDEAKAKGVTVEQLRKQLVPEQVEVAQAEVDKIYAANASRFASLSEDEAKQRIKMDMENRAKFEAFQKALARMRTEAGVEMMLPEPAAPTLKVSTAGPSKGRADAPVTIVEYSDFQCPYCKKASGTLKQLLADYGDKVRLVYKHSPLPNHEHAFKAAQASVCAAEQGKFWEYHDILFERSNSLGADSLKRYAAELGLKTNEFNACLDSEASRAAVTKDLQEAQQAGISGTPPFIINGRPVRGNKPPEEFKAVVDQELRKVSPSGSARLE